jgi:hypothetical protein
VLEVKKCLEQESLESEKWRVNYDCAKAKLKWMVHTNKPINRKTGNTTAIAAKTD